MLKLNKSELARWKHVLEKQKEINELCKSNPNKIKCCLIHTKLVRDIDNELKEVSYMCEKQKQEHQILGKLKLYKSPINFENHKTSYKIELNKSKRVFENSIQNTKSIIRLIKETIRNPRTTSTFGYVDLPFLFSTELNNKLDLDFELLEKLKNVDILFLDNLGAEPKNRFLFENYILEVLRVRQLNDKKTFIFIEKEFQKIYEFEKQYEKTLIERLKKYI